jgi:hypothetical protein
MAFNPDSRHPLYKAFAPSWCLMRDAIEGEETIKAKGQAYLPMKSGIVAMTDLAKQGMAYEAYKLRAEFPELVAPTIRGSVGTMLEKPAVIELPDALEPLREKATRDGMTLDALHRRICVELMSVGRYGVLPGIGQDGAPYLAGYVAEAITNWDEPDHVVDWLMLDESAPALDRDTGEWDQVERYRECFVENGRYYSRVWTKTTSGWTSDEPVGASGPPKGGRERPIGILPFVFIDAADLSANPDDVPLYGLAKLAVRVYRMDADYTFALHMTSEPTPVAIGFDSPKDAVKNGEAPTTLGSSKLWLLPKGGDAKYLEFSGPGLEQQAKAIDASLQRAIIFGAQLFADNKKSAESGEAIKTRLGNQQATLRSIAQNSAAGLERALKNTALWVGADPDKVKVTPNLDFADHTLDAQEITAIVGGWQSGAYSWRSAFDRLQKGGVIPDDRTPEEELEMIDQDEVDHEDEAAAMLPAPKQ